MCFNIRNKENSNKRTNIHIELYLNHFFEMNKIFVLLEMFNISSKFSSSITIKLRTQNNFEN